MNKLCQIHEIVMSIRNKEAYTNSAEPRRIRGSRPKGAPYIWEKRFYLKAEKTFFFYSLRGLNPLFLKGFQLQVEIFNNNKFYYFNEYVSIGLKIIKRNLQFMEKKSFKNSKKRLEFLKF